MRIVTKSKELFIIATLILFIAGLFLNYDEIKISFTADLKRCIDNILPPLFPMLILSSFLSESELIARLFKKNKDPKTALARFSLSLFPEIIFGVVGGYPVGVKTLSGSVAKNPALKHNARLLALCSINPGPAFTVLVVGKSVFGTINAGASLYISVTAANMLLFIFLFLLFGEKTDLKSKTPSTDTSADTALVNAVKNATENACSITAWIILFGILYTILSQINVPFFSSFLNLTGEITHAVDHCFQRHSLSLCAFALSFAGVCIYCQILPDLHRLDIKLFPYFLCRAICGLFSLLIEMLILRLFPSIAAVNVSYSTGRYLFNADLTRCISLAVLSVFFMLGVNEKKLKIILKK